ncbi:MAG: histidine kinase [Lentisphaerae bacterium GWF2_45_14]|nr:MAG: histidine kinase [Lentisphaerae bacterium GWF2_45_14]
MNRGTNAIESMKSFTILVIDDTPTNVMILKKTLLNSGYNVLTAEDGRSGRKIAEEEKPDIILLDIMMPEEDGFETITKLKSNPSTASIPVIFLTALSDIESKVSGFELGAVDYITKPFHPLEIRARTRLHIKLNIATNALIETQREKLKQIETAQQAMLVSPEEMPEANFSVYYSPLHEAGGDFYDVIRINHHTHAYFVADVSGHDIGTSFITASVKALIRQNCSQIYTVDETMSMVNSVLLSILPEDKYLTACYITLNRHTNSISMVNMGHPPALFVPLSGVPKVILSESDILGAYAGAMMNEYTIKVQKGDRLFLYTDGLVENSEKKLLWTKSIESIKECADKCIDVPLHDAVRNIKNHFYPSLRQPTDDIVILGIEV